MNRTKIEYLDFTWNPFAMLCEPVSFGCRICWHRRRAKMLANNPLTPKDQQAAYAGKSPPLLIESRLDDPPKVKKPSMIGVQFMGDIFHDKIPKGIYGKIFDRVYMSSKAKFMKPKSLDEMHKFLFLTKRIKRAAEIIDHWSGRYGGKMPDNLWLGVSVEDQPTADQRIPELLKLRSFIKVLFVSVEPMLENLKIGYWLDPFRKLDTTYRQQIEFGMFNKYQVDSLKEPTIDCVIAGPEAGPGARPCPPGAIESLYEQCKNAGVPFFDKSKNYIAREFPR